MTNILGFTSSVDSGATLIQDKKILHSINEERLKRQKLFFGTPFESIDLILKLNNLKREDIDIVTACGFSRGMTPLNDYTR
ncbi:MAG: hypothetical protein Q7S21_00590, partial [archaeon]|nr:hypothetical protein [archaeon]